MEPPRPTRPTRGCWLMGASGLWFRTLADVLAHCNASNGCAVTPWASAVKLTVLWLSLGNTACSKQLCGVTGWSQYCC